MNQLIKWSFVNLFGMITYQAVFRVTQTTSKHLPDTLRHLPDNPKSINVGIVRGSGRNFLSLLGKAVVEYNVLSFLCVSNCYSINTVLAISKVNQTVS